MEDKMPKKVMVLFTLIFVIISISAYEEPAKTIEVFYKNKKPSLKTMEKTKTILNKYKDVYEIIYYDIDDSANINLIQRYDLPDTHFPFAVVINGKFSVEIDSIKIDFVHFPLFMHGIGRHEGNWSLADLEKALANNNILLENNILPDLEHEEDGEEPCSE